jgi:hypothetical protein
LVPFIYNTFDTNPYSSDFGKPSPWRRGNLGGRLIGRRPDAGHDSPFLNLAESQRIAWIG